MRIFVIALFVCLVTAEPAVAQIYTWRDAAGHLVLSNKPREGVGPVATYAVPGPARLRTTTRPATARASSHYDDLIELHAQAYGMSPDLIRAVIQAESGFNPRAVSPKGAMGLMQLMPATARELGVTDPFHPDDNIRGGVSYLAGLMSRYDQSIELALAAYNAGPGSVERYRAVPPYRETQNYVKKITGATRSAAPARQSPPVIYKWVELLDGKSITRYSNRPPKDFEYTVVGRR
jgi:soluble lytic murein transglycosylase-like protein